MKTDRNPTDLISKTRFGHEQAIIASYQFTWMQDLVPGFPVSLPACASRTPALEGYALPTSIATWQFRRVTVSTNILTSKAPDSWQAQVAQALLPVRFC
jgi:hypothetical protein